LRQSRNLGASAQTMQNAHFEPIVTLRGLSCQTNFSATTALDLPVMPNNFGVDGMKNETVRRSGGDTCICKLEIHHLRQSRNLGASAQTMQNAHFEPIVTLRGLVGCN
jgi:hypothetical protein